MKIKPAAFLDRDGVINLDHGHVGKYENIDYVKGVFNAVRILNHNNYRVFIVTNQAGIAKGLYSEDDFYDCMNKIKHDFAKNGAYFDDIMFCPYHKDALNKKYYQPNHPDRKPNPGMLVKLIDKWPTKLSKSFMVGDRDTDILAATSLGLNSFLFENNIPLDSFIKDKLNLFK